MVEVADPLVWTGAAWTGPLGPVRRPEGCQWAVGQLVANSLADGATLLAILEGTAVHPDLGWFEIGRASLSSAGVAWAGGAPQPLAILAFRWLRWRISHTGTPPIGAWLSLHGE
jgi:hypothetical protein